MRAGTFATPLAAQTLICPHCNEPKLTEVAYGLVEKTLAAFVLDEEEQAEYRKRVEMRCTACGWRGTAWKREAEAA